jgi:Domain of unknown function DUF29
MSEAAPIKRARQAGRPPTRYEDDIHAWAKEQARLLRAGRFDRIDAENLAEEVADAGKRECDKLESALRVLLTHMLEWDHQPKQRSRSWESTIREQRRRVGRQLRKNPSLKSRLAEALDEAYPDARDRASAETDMDVEIFPEACPYDWGTMLTRPFERPSG